jgi:hypothetical protein
MTEIEFKAWPKTPRLNNDMIVTEKVDGTNGCIVILPWTEGVSDYLDSDEVLNYVSYEGQGYIVGAQSRNRLVTVEKDNAGFAAWVRENSGELVIALGEGYHYGEWWGYKINRGYGLQAGDRRFSLFNVGRYGPLDLSAVPGLKTVPLLYQGLFDTDVAMSYYDYLMDTGSFARPGYHDPEGIIVYHTASKQVYKVTEGPKWKLAEAQALKEAA